MLHWDDVAAANAAIVSTGERIYQCHRTLILMLPLSLLPLLRALPLQFAEAIAVAITTAITPPTSLTLPQHSCRY